MVEKCMKAKKYASQSKATNPGKDIQETGTVIAKTMVSSAPTTGITRLKENLKLKFSISLLSGMSNLQRYL